jgi:cubilin
LTTSSGTFQTPNWPETYPVSIDCEWRIQLPDASKVVEIRCEESPFGIAGSLPACSRDYLKFYDGHSEQNTEFGPFCHYAKPSTATMSSNKAMAVFHAGPRHNAVRKGFKCSFQSIDISSTPDSQCGGTLTAASGSFQSPNWPQTYPVNIDCTWTIILPDSSKRVEIDFDSPFGIAGSLPTCKDKLHVYDDNTGTQYGPYCYFTVPNPPIMSSNRARVELNAGPSHNPSRVGFRVTYRSV